VTVRRLNNVRCDEAEQQPPTTIHSSNPPGTSGPLLQTAPLAHKRRLTSGARDDLHHRLGPQAPEVCCTRTPPRWNSTCRMRPRALRSASRRSASRRCSTTARTAGATGASGGCTRAMRLARPPITPPVHMQSLEAELRSKRHNRDSRSRKQGKGEQGRVQRALRQGVGGSHWRGTRSGVKHVLGKEGAVLLDLLQLHHLATSTTPQGGSTTRGTVGCQDVPSGRCTRLVQGVYCIRFLEL